MRLEWFMEGIATLAEYLCVFYFIQDDKPKNRFNPLNIALAIPITLYIILMNRLQMISFHAISGYFVYLAFAAFIIYRKNWIDKVLLSILFLLLITACDYFSIALLGTVFANKNFVNDVLSITSENRKYFLLIDKTFLVICTVLVKYYIQKYIKQEKYKFLIAFATTCILLVYITYHSSSVYALFGWSIYVITGSMLAIVFCFYKKWQEAKAMNELSQLQSLSYMEYYGDLCKQQEDTDRTLHDIRYHFLNLSQLLEDKKYEECSKYLNIINGSLEKCSFISYTGNKYIDFLINYKKHEAEEQSIAVQINADVICESDDFWQEDITIILGNLLDNAIEACSGLSAADKWIEIKLNQVKKMLFITIKNNYNASPKVVNGLLITQKENPQIHGLGLENVKECVEKYNGTFDVKFGEAVFIAEVTMFI